MTTNRDLHGEPCPPHIDRSLALLSAGLLVLDVDLAEAALEADLLLRQENPRWVVISTVPEQYRAPTGGWLDVPTAEAALCDAVDLLDIHAEKHDRPAERLIGTAAIERLMLTLRHRVGTARWAAERDVRVAAEAT